MKKTLRCILSILLSAIFIVGCFAGCAKQDEDETPHVGLEITEPVTLTVLTTRHTEATTAAEDLWFFKYMEWWYEQKGYDVTIEVQQTTEAGTQASLLLNTDSLPDIMWSIALSSSNTMTYGVEDNLILDWTPYLTEELMPNLLKQFDANPSMKAAHIAPDGGIYGIPYITPYPYSTVVGLANRVYVRQSWLDAVGKKVPTTQEEFLDVLRAFKNYKMPDGSKTYPLLSDVNFLEKYLWLCLGYYGTEAARFGTTFMVKDGKVQLPCYTEDYRDFIEIMHTMYSEGILPVDYFSMSSGHITGLINAGNGGMHCWWTLQYVGDDYADSVMLGPIPMGDNDDVYVSRLSDFTANEIWVSADTKYPELVAMMIDYLFSEEGSWLYQYGPEKGKDPLGIVDGWYYNDKGLITNDLVENGTYTAFELWARDYIRPHDYAGLRVDPVTTGTGEIVTYKDAVTGKDLEFIHDRTMTRSSNDEWWRLESIDKWTDYATAVRLPKAYLDSDNTALASDYSSAINTYVTTESVKFITGMRPLSEIDAFFAQLKKLGVEEYIKIYEETYANFISETYG